LVGGLLRINRKARVFDPVARLVHAMPVDATRTADVERRHAGVRQDQKGERWCAERFQPDHVCQMRRLRALMPDRATSVRSFGRRRHNAFEPQVDRADAIHFRVVSEQSE
jgi:hypothetical protein